MGEEETELTETEKFERILEYEEYEDELRGTITEGQPAFGESKPYFARGMAGKFVLCKRVTGKDSIPDRLKSQYPDHLITFEVMMPSSTEVEGKIKMGNGFQNGEFTHTSISQDEARNIWNDKVANGYHRSN